MSPDELRAIELDENAQRLALNDYETSKARLAQIRQAEADLKAAAAKEGHFAAGAAKIRRRVGRPKKPASGRALANATGVSDREHRRLEKRVATAEQFRFRQRPDWKQHHVLEAGAAVEQIPEADRSAIGALLDQDAIPPKTAIGILQAVRHGRRNREAHGLAPGSNPYPSCAVGIRISGYIFEKRNLGVVWAV